MLKRPPVLLKFYSILCMISFRMIEVVEFSIISSPAVCSNTVMQLMLCPQNKNQTIQGLLSREVINDPYNTSIFIILNCLFCPVIDCDPLVKPAWSSWCCQIITFTLLSQTISQNNQRTISQRFWDLKYSLKIPCFLSLLPTQMPQVVEIFLNSLRPSDAYMHQ